MLEFIVREVNRAFELKEALSKSYDDVIVVFESNGDISVAADTNSVKKN